MLRRRYLLLLVATASLLWTACTPPETPSKGGGDGVAVEETIGADGGSVDGGDVAVFIDSGVLGQDTEVRLEVADEASPPTYVDGVEATGTLSRLSLGRDAVLGTASAADASIAPAADGAGADLVLRFADAGDPQVDDPGFAEVTVLLSAGQPWRHVAPMGIDERGVGTVVISIAALQEAHATRGLPDPIEIDVRPLSLGAAGTTSLGASAIPTSPRIRQAGGLYLFDDAFQAGDPASADVTGDLAAICGPALDPASEREDASARFVRLYETSTDSVTGLSRLDPTRTPLVLVHGYTQINDTFATVLAPAIRTSSVAVDGSRFMVDFVDAFVWTRDVFDVASDVLDALESGGRLVSGIDDARDRLAQGFDFVPAACYWKEFLKTYFDPNPSPEIGALRDRYQLFSFGFDTRDPIEANGARLADALDAVFGPVEVVVLGHSTGGLVARSAIDPATQGQAGNVGTLIGLGSPFRGAGFMACREVSGDRCVEAMVDSTIIRNEETPPPVDLKSPVDDVLEALADHLATELIRGASFDDQGTRDLTYQTARTVDTYLIRECPSSPLTSCIAGSDRIVEVASEPNPFLTKLSQEPSDVPIVSIVGLRNVGPRQPAVPGGGIEDAITAAYDFLQGRYDANGWDSDGFITYDSASFDTSRRDRSSRTGYPTTTVPGMTHSQLIGVEYADALVARLLDLDPPDGGTDGPSIQASVDRSLLPSGAWRTTLLYPSVLTGSSSFSQIGASADVAPDGGFLLDLADVTPPPVSLNDVTAPSGAVVDPSDVQGASFSLVVFDDADRDGGVGTGESVFVLDDPDNTFGDGTLVVNYADRAYTIQGTSVSTEGTPVVWDVDADAGWGRTIYETSAGGTEIAIRYSTTLSGLVFVPDLGGTVGLRSLATHDDEAPPLLFEPSGEGLD